MKLTSKLLLPQLVLLAVLLAGSGALTLHLHERDRASVELTQGLAEGLMLGLQLREQYSILLVNVLGYRQDRQPSRLDAVIRAEQASSRTLDRLMPLVDDARQNALARRLVDAHGKMLVARSGLVQAIQAGDAARLALAFDTWQLHRNRLDASLSDLTAHQRFKMEANREALALQEARFLQGEAVFFALGLAIIVVSYVLLRRRLSTPLAHLTAGLDAMAPNRLDARLDRRLEQNGDELGRLARAFNAMADRLQTYYLEMERARAERERAQSELRQAHGRLEERVLERTAELAEANRSLEAEILVRLRAEKDLEAYSYTVSHDLRAPLRALNGFAHMLVKDCAQQLAPVDRQHLERILANAERMDGLIHALLDLARLGRQPMKVERFRLGDLVAECLETLQPEMADRNIDLEVGDLPECQGDPALIRQVLMNLLSNALKYTRGRDPAKLTVGCERRGGEALCFVRDNGVGFDMRYANKLFGVFERLHRADEFEGLGIGLASAKRICERHGGRIFAEAETGRGATFYFTCPNCVASDEETANLQKRAASA